MTVSVVAASFPPDEGVRSLIERADSCLYAARHNGRNRVICEVDLELLAFAEQQVA